MKRPKISSVNRIMWIHITKSFSHIYTRLNKEKPLPEALLTFSNLLACGVKNHLPVSWIVIFPIFLFGHRFQRKQHIFVTSEVLHFSRRNIPPSFEEYLLGNWDCTKFRSILDCHLLWEIQTSLVSILGGC